MKNEDIQFIDLTRNFEPVKNQPGFETGSFGIKVSYETLK
jgi:hypothetical protein